METQIADLYKFTFNNPENFKRNIDIEIIENSLALKILQFININLEGFIISLDNYAILHTINKHGQESEYKRGQIPVKENDFEKIVVIIKEFDNLRIDKNMLIFEKLLDNKYFVAGEIRLITSKGKNKVNRLAFVTMYIRKEKPSDC